jgi:FAD dependent oxidoreductase TIGR03364
MKQRFDIAVIGAGILGLAHAWHAARAGLSVAVFERDSQALGASVRNFGMLAIIAQKPGRPLRDAQRALQHWQVLAGDAGISLRQAGCLFVARETAELSVLREFADSGTELAATAKLLDVAQLAATAPWLNRGNLLGGLWSPDAWKVDQRNVIAEIAVYLQAKLGVRFFFNEAVVAVDAGHLQTTRGDYRAEHTILCGGCDFATLFPDAFAATGVSHCRLQMLATGSQPSSDKLKPFVLGGLSMSRYETFAECDSLAELKHLQRHRYADFIQNGVHVIASQEADGSITAGDSHHYGVDHHEDRLDEVDQLITQELYGMLNLPDQSIVRRWFGHYAHHAEKDLVRIEPANGVTAVTVTNGQGMTHGMAIAEDVIGLLTGRA